MPPEEKAAVASKPSEPSCITMKCRDAIDKYVEIAMQCVRYVDCTKLTELLKPIYDERALIAQYRDEVKNRSVKGELVKLAPKDFEREFTNISPLKRIERNMSHKFRGNPKDPPRNTTD